LASVLEALGEEGVARVRLGIRPAIEPEDLSEFVLEAFTPEERRIVEEVVDRAAAATRCILLEGMDKAMSMYNAISSE
jgi:PTH1 family peptidyl-tRNA hydrolase